MNAARSCIRAGGQRTRPISCYFDVGLAGGLACRIGELVASAHDRGIPHNAKDVARAAL